MWFHFAMGFGGAALFWLGEGSVLPRVRPVGFGD